MFSGVAAKWKRCAEVVINPIRGLRQWRPFAKNGWAESVKTAEASLWIQFAPIVTVDIQSPAGDENKSRVV